MKERGGETDRIRQAERQSHRKVFQFHQHLLLQMYHSKRGRLVIKGGMPFLCASPSPPTITLLFQYQTPLSCTLHYKRTTDIFITLADSLRRLSNWMVGFRGGVLGTQEQPFRPHLLFIVNFRAHNHPKMQTDCRKIKQKIRWPWVTGDAGVWHSQLIGARVHSNLLSMHG